MQLIAPETSIMISQLNESCNGLPAIMWQPRSQRNRVVSSEAVAAETRGCRPIREGGSSLQRWPPAATGLAFVSTVLVGSNRAGRGGDAAAVSKPCRTFDQYNKQVLPICKLT